MLGRRDWGRGIAVTRSGDGADICDEIHLGVGVDACHTGIAIVVACCGGSCTVGIVRAARGFCAPSFCWSKLGMNFTHVTSDVLLEGVAFSTYLTGIFLHFGVRQLVTTQLALCKELGIAIARVRLALMTLHMGFQGLFRLVVIFADNASIRLACAVDLSSCQMLVAIRHSLEVFPTLDATCRTQLSQYATHRAHIRAIPVNRS